MENIIKHATNAIIIIPRTNLNNLNNQSQLNNCQHHILNISNLNILLSINNSISILNIVYTLSFQYSISVLIFHSLWYNNLPKRYKLNNKMYKDDNDNPLQLIQSIYLEIQVLSLPSLNTNLLNPN